MAETRPLGIAGAVLGVGIGILGAIHLPDIDQSLLPILHHRSILTHSLLAVLLLALVLGVGRGRWILAGMLWGLSIHLSADLLSRPVGYGAVWLPWPVKLSLGPLSQVWLGANALSGAVLARMLTRGPLQGPAEGLALASGAAYAVMNEGALAPLLVFVLMLAAARIFSR